MDTPEKSPLKAVILVREDGSIYALQGDDAKTWDKAVENAIMMDFVHHAGSQKLLGEIKAPEKFGPGTDLKYVLEALNLR